MVGTLAGKWSVKVAARYAYAAGVTGILANLSLIVMYILLGFRAWSPEARISLDSAFHVAGSASDLLGSLSTAFMIPVALFLGGHLPRRRVARLAQAAGLAAMALLSVGGPLLVLGVLTFEVETPIAMAMLIVLGLWLFVVNRWLRLSAAIRPRVARLGEFVGTCFLAGYVVFGLGLLLPWMSWPQLVVFGVGVVIGLPAYLGIPVWFVLLGRDLGKS